MKGIVAAIVFGLFGIIFAIVAMATPMYSQDQNGVTQKAYPFKFCVDSPGFSKCWMINDSDCPIQDSQKSVFRFICALLFFFFFAAILGLVLSILERFGRTRKIHLMIAFIVAAVLAFLGWVVMVGNYHNGKPVNGGDSWSQQKFDLSASPAMMIVSWLATMVGVVLAWKIPGREDEGEQGAAPGSGFTQGQGYKYAAV